MTGALPRPKISARTVMLDLKINRSGFSDPAFTENRASGLHRWVPWIGGFSANFVAEAIEKYSPTGGLVVDPFAGVGTTLLETVRRGVSYEALGFEINPYAAFAAQTKLDALRIRASEVRRFADRFRSEAHSAASADEPAGFRSRISFYSPRVLSQVLRTLDGFMDLNPLRSANSFFLLSAP